VEDTRKESSLIQINRDEVTRLTEEYGGVWGINHTRRLLQLIAVIGEGLRYDADAIWLAAHLHDWGAYPPWAQKGVDHALRSRQVAETFLTERGCAPETKALILECIALHHTGGSDRSLEATLMRDADCLDFLGTVGVLRDFSKNPRDMRKAYEQVKKRHETVPGLLSLDTAKTMAAERVREMDQLMKDFEAESFGCF
jgi:uncharacterized protein